MNPAWQAWAHSDVGRRKNNEDAWLIAPGPQIFAVADGMGGHEAGEVASRLALETLCDIVTQQPPEACGAPALAAALAAASREVYREALRRQKLRGMGTTVTAVHYREGWAHFAHVGDSRLYLVRGGFVYQQTRDHTLVAEEVQRGRLRPEDAASHRLSNVITRCVGLTEDERVDSGSFPVAGGDGLLLCSDGLHGVLGPQLWSEDFTLPPQSVAPSLVQRALTRGSRDNVTALTLFFTEGYRDEANKDGSDPLRSWDHPEF